MLARLWPLVLGVAVLVAMVVLAGPALVFGVLAAAGIVVAAFGFVLLRTRRGVAVPLLVGGLVVAVVAFVALVAGIDDRASDWFNLE